MSSHSSGGALTTLPPVTPIGTFEWSIQTGLKGTPELAAMYGLPRGSLAGSQPPDRQVTHLTRLIEDLLEVTRVTRGKIELRRERLDLNEVVLCDIGLPGLDGYAVARAFRSDPVLCPMYLIALTGYAHPDDVAKARAAGFDQHLAKPPTLEALEQALAAASPADAGLS